MSRKRILPCEAGEGTTRSVMEGRAPKSVQAVAGLNLTTDSTPSTMNTASTMPCVIAKGGSEPVGA